MITDIKQYVDNFEKDKVLNDKGRRKFFIILDIDNKEKQFNLTPMSAGQLIDFVAVAKQSKEIMGLIMNENKAETQEETIKHILNSAKTIVSQEIEVLVTLLSIATEKEFTIQEISKYRPFEIVDLLYSLYRVNMDFFHPMLVGNLEKIMNFTKLAQKAMKEQPKSK